MVTGGAKRELKMQPSANDKHLFYAEMAKLLEAGFDIRKAAAVLNDTQLPPAQKWLLKDLESGLQAGETITGAFGKDEKAITSLERSIIGAGERGGKLAPAFKHLADYFSMVASARRELVKGMIYPIIVLHLGVFIATVPMGIMQESASIGKILGGFLLTLLGIYVIALILFFAARAILAMAPESPAIDHAVNRIPWIGKARKNMAMSRFCKVYHSCLLAGISMTETVRVSSDAAQSGKIKVAGKRIEQIARDGNALGPQFMAEETFPKSFARSYATGEEAGTLDKDLGNWAAKFQQDSEDAMRTAAIMVPKIMYFIILAFVAWKIISFFSGYYAELDKIGE